ncbi:reelin domain-containing protein 1-like isoform X2 [Lepisosteus oculatus]|uniref:reelin domain-containing protein 1-like isoform X2 n=1 Tax=Lepisosteus oculatus TaxID=7918 RepID=UPI0035F529F0
MHVKTFKRAESGSKQLLLVGVALSLVSCTWSFSHGANPSACMDMKPRHISAQPQDPHNNYITLQTEAVSYHPGGTVPVAVRSTRDFMGFLLQARRVTDDRIAGTFILIPHGSKRLRCEEEGDTVTHSDKQLKRNLSFVWRAPDRPAGDVRFFITVVQSYFTYWARIESAVVHDQTPANFTPVVAVAGQEIAPSGLAFDINMTSTASAPGVHITNGPTTTTEVIKAATELSPQTLSADPEDRSAGEPRETTPSGSLGEELGSPLTLVSLSPRATGELHLTHRTQQPTRPSLLPGFNWTRNYPKYSVPQLCKNCNNREEFQLGLEGEHSAHSALSSDVGNGDQQGSPTAAGDASPAPRGTPADREVPLVPTALLRPQEQAEPETWASLHLKPSPALRRSLSGAATQATPADSLLRTAALGSRVRNVSVAGEKGRPRETGLPGKVPHLGPAELGILLGCAAALGMAVTTGLRYLHSQYCRKRTEVSISDRDSNVIHVQECGDLVQVRKIRQNSFVLLEAEYDVITPVGK